MPVIELNQKHIPSLMADGKQTEWCDSLVKGLYILVTSTGNMTYYWRTKINGKTKHILIAKVADISLASAREKVLLWKSGITLPDSANLQQLTAPAHEITLNDFWNCHYLPQAKQRKRSWSRDEQLWRIRIAPKFGSRRLCDLQRQEIQMFHGSLVQSDGLAPASADLHAALLKRMFSLAVEWGMLEKNPITKMQLFHADNRVENYLSESQLAKLMSVLKTDPNRVVCQICIFLLSTGCRLNEVLSAKWSQVDREKCVLKINANNSKSKRMRYVPLNKNAMNILDEVATEGKFDYVFVNPQTATKFVTITRAWYRLRAKAGINHCRLHDLRHFAASALINSGASLFIVQQVLGHSSPVMTQRYAHLSMQSLHEASARAAEVVDQASKNVKMTLIKAA